MASLKFLSLDEARAYGGAWPDVYFTPGYGAAAEISDNARWEVAIWEPGPIVYPYLFKNLPTGGFKVSSPYGYAGTWSPSDVPLSEWRAFRGALRTALCDRGCVHEFQRLGSLVFGRERLLESDLSLVGRQHNETVAIDLTDGYQRCWDAAEGRSRTKTRKARRLGYQWRCYQASAATVAPAAPFRRLYADNMRRIDSSQYYFFSDAYFETLQLELGSQLRVLEVLSPSGEPVVAGLFMLWDRFVHLHLLGTTSGALRDGAGNLAYDGLIRWGCEQGDFDLVHIGGGLAANDDLFYFKRSFGGRRLPFWVAEWRGP